MNRGTVHGALSLTEHNEQHFEQEEHLINRSEHSEDVFAPGILSRSYTPPPVPDFWREMSPQLSYIDGSSVSSVVPSYGRSISWNLADLDLLPRAPKSLDPLDIYQGGFSPLPSITQLARHASDSLYPTLQSNKDRHQGEMEEVSFSPDMPFKRLTRPSGLSNTSDPSNNNPSGISGSRSPQLAVVRLQRSAVKCKIQKRLSFGDKLDLQTIIYTPDVPEDLFDGNIPTSAFPSNNSVAKGRSDEQGRSYKGPPLVRRKSDDVFSQSLYMEKDLRYYFQHPWFRLFIAYLVIFCNFLLFAEDPVSHSHSESRIPVVGNVFSFVINKYPDEWYWKTIKVITWLIGILCGMLVGKVLIHGIVFKRMLRLKMFRDEQGSWMVMFLTVIVSLYMFSYVYNLILLIGHWNYFHWQIDRSMGVTNENMMKAAATLTWLGDLVTALMVTDMMLQDNLYPHWLTAFRRLYRLSNVPRILVFWFGSIIVIAIVIFLIVSDFISWDSLNKGFVETTELSRAFLASFILVMDLLIMMQDWDFPHFTSTIDVNLPGFSTHILHWRYAETKVTGKWFNYGIIFMVMMFDLNMWKNQIFYDPVNYGQYIDPNSRKVFTVEDEDLLWLGNGTIWTWDSRGDVDIFTGRPFRQDDMFMFSRYMNYGMAVKSTAFIPNILGFIMLFTLITLYGRFPPNQDGTHGGRLKKKKKRTSSWRRERRNTGDPFYHEDIVAQVRETKKVNVKNKDNSTKL